MEMKLNVFSPFSKKKDSNFSYPSIIVNVPNNIRLVSFQESVRIFYPLLLNGIVDAYSLTIVEDLWNNRTINFIPQHKVNITTAHIILGDILLEFTESQRLEITEQEKFIMSQKEYLNNVAQNALFIKKQNYTFNYKDN